MMNWAALFVFLLQNSTVGGINQYHLADMLRTLHNNWSSVITRMLTVGCWRFVSKSKNYFGNSKKL